MIIYRVPRGRYMPGKATKKKAVKPRKKMGRPRIEIDTDQVSAFCQVLCTQEEIALFLGCSIETLNRRIKEKSGLTFAGFYQKHSVGGKMSLRRYQYLAAKDGNPTMLVWLGKQVLGQRDKPEGDEIAAPQPVKIIIQVEDGRKSQSE